jgi:hypothetical protein
MLPKNCNPYISIQPIIDNKSMHVYTSYSIYNYYCEVCKQLIQITMNSASNAEDGSFNNIDFLMKEFNPYEYIFSKVPGSKFSVSKLKTKTNVFYELLEIVTTLNCFDSFKNANISFLYFGDNFDDVTECLNLVRENKDDLINHHSKIEKKINDISDEMRNRYDFLFYEINTNSIHDLNLYIIRFIETIMLLLKYQTTNGTCIIKINHVVHKPIIDLIYILTSLYEKTYIIKPNSSNITSFDKYLVCKNFGKSDVYKYYYHKFNELLTNYFLSNTLEVNQNILSIIQTELPYYFINKIDDMNIIIGQQQLECIDQIIGIFKNNNKHERVEYIRKVNIQKSVNWCEKFKIPCNKFLEKTNIFLPISKAESKEQKSKENHSII